MWRNLFYACLDISSPWNWSIGRFMETVKDALHKICISFFANVVMSGECGWKTEIVMEKLCFIFICPRMNCLHFRWKMKWFEQSFMLRKGKVRRKLHDGESQHKVVPSLTFIFFFILNIYDVIDNNLKSHHYDVIDHQSY